MGARHYDPELGRWLSADTLVPEPTNPQSLNRHSWVLGNPLGYADPSGHFDQEVVAKYFGCEDMACIERLKNSDYSTWFWMLRAAQDGDMLEIITCYGGEYLGKVHLTDNGALEFAGSLAEGLDYSWLPINDNRSSFMIKHYGGGDPTGAMDYDPGYVLYGEDEFRRNATGVPRTYHRFDPGRVSWEDVALDTIGTVASVVGANEFVEALQVAPEVAEGARFVNAGLGVYGLAEAVLNLEPVMHFWP
jgi:hypothetical protein